MENKIIEGAVDLSIDDYAPEAVEFFKAVASCVDPENDDFEITLAREEQERLYRMVLRESGTTPVSSMPEKPIYFSDVMIESIDLLPLNQLPEEKIIVTEHVDFSTKKTN